MPTSTSTETPGTTGAPAPIPVPQGDPFGSVAATPSVTAADDPSYSEASAFDYAEKWNGGCNPYYTCYGNDCQNYVSAILHAGGMPFFNNGFFTWEAQTPDFYNVVDFQNYAAYIGYYEFLSSWGALRPGDILQVNWSGGDYPEHAAYVDDIEGGLPMVAAHTNQVWNYPITNWWAEFPSSTWWLIHPE
jgi:Putative amidase domain